MSRRVLLVLFALFLMVFPAAAQNSRSPADLIPADAAGFIRLRMDNPAQTLNNLNLLAALVSTLQPARLQMSAALDYDGFIPLNTLFDVENVSFASNVLPWLGGELILAYRQFDAALRTSPEDILLILPTRDMFIAASSLSPVIEGQDTLKRDTYRDTTIYAGDKTAIAITTSVVLIGADSLVRQALDVQAGEGQSLIGTTAYRAMQAGSTANPLIYAYVTGAVLPQAVNGVVSGDPATQPLFAAFGSALNAIRGTAGLDTLLLSGGFDAASLSLNFAPDSPRLEAVAVFHTPAVPDVPAASKFDAALLDYVPRSALLVHQGSRLKDLGYSALTALTLSNFSGPMLGGLPFVTIGANSPLMPPPAAADLQNAAAGFFDGLKIAADFDVQADLLDKLTNDYVLALLPRPNDPLPVLRLPFDTLLVTPIDDADAPTLTQNLNRLLQLVFGVQPLPADESVPFTRLGSGQAVIFETGVVDGILIIGTGDAAERALAAQAGDNRLIEQPAWSDLSQPETPGWYLDASVLFNTFFPSAGGSVPGLNQRIRLGLWSAQPERRLFELKLVVTLPTGS